MANLFGTMANFFIMAKMVSEFAMANSLDVPRQIHFIVCDKFLFLRSC